MKDNTKSLLGDRVIGAIPPDPLRHRLSTRVMAVKKIASITFCTSTLPIMIATQRASEAIPLGSSVPALTPHAISVSLPTWRDNVGYEEGDKRVVDRMETGYPRFFIHRSIQKVGPGSPAWSLAEISLPRSALPNSVARTSSASSSPHLRSPRRAVTFSPIRNPHSPLGSSSLSSAPPSLSLRVLPLPWTAQYPPCPSRMPHRRPAST